MSTRPLQYTLRLATFLTATFALTLCTARADNQTENQTARPDILLIMPDQMRGDCLSILGHPAVRTPNFDRLAENGVLFRRAYTTVPS